MTSSSSIFCQWVVRWTVVTALFQALLSVNGISSERRRSALRFSSSNMETESPTSDFEHMHVIRRVYGKQNARVRETASNLMNRIERFQTGLPGDPNHIVPYENHPYDHTALRQLKSNGTNINILYQPIRIKFFTFALDSIRNSTNSAGIDWFISTILPLAGNFWSQALSVVPVSGNLVISPAELDQRMYCGDPSLSKVPAEHMSTGVPDVDLIIYVSGSDNPMFCAPDTLAVAVPCNFDQFDRPTAGAVNVCLGNINLQSDGTASSALVTSYKEVTMHEIAHVLGLTSDTFRFYWDPNTGKPRTPRPFAITDVTCVTGQNQTIALPANNTVVLTNDDVGRRYAIIVTERVRTIARNQFNCQSLLGGNLENEPTNPASCLGDHWDERLYYPELMTPVISSTTNFLSPITLAIMEDSGWYVANYTQSIVTPWGLGAGCDFVNAKCLNVSSSGTTVPDFNKGYFCSVENEKGCSQGFTHKMACTILDYAYFVPQTPPPAEFQYFPNSPSKGGPVTADWCPVYETPYNSMSVAQLDCRDPNNANQLSSGGSLNVYSEVWGPDSRCIPTTLGEGLCFRTACIQDPMGVSINVRGQWLTCEYDFQEIKIVVGQGLLPTTIICPRILQMCPQLACPFQCAGRGVCNYNGTSVNGTVLPKCECFDANDTSAGCSNSLIPNGNFFKDSSGLKNNVQQNFFDPLVAVFAQKPNTWTNESWMWAAGLIAIFVILLCCICSSFFPSSSRKQMKY